MIRPISSADLAALIEGGGHDEGLPEGRTRIFDLRDPEEFVAGHVPSARYVSSGQALRWIPQWVLPNELVVLIDHDGGRGGAARHLATKLVHHWFRRIRYLSGGMAAWSKDELPLEAGGPAGATAASDCGKQSSFHRSGAVRWSTSRNPLPPDPARVKYETPDSSDTSAT